MSVRAGIRPALGHRSLVHLADAVLLTLTGLLFYAVSLAPTVMWFDGGYLQLIAAQGAVKASAGSHPLWVWVAHQFVRLLPGDVAGRINFVSAVFGAITVGLVYLVLYEIELPRFPRIAATLAFMVSHTFWTNAVSAEVYTLTLALMALQIWSVLRWRRSENQAYLALAGAAVGLGAAAHLLVWLYVPALFWLAWEGRARLRLRGVLLFGMGLLLSLTPLMVLLLRDARQMGLDGRALLQWAIFSSDGNDFRSAFFDFSLRLLPADLFQWLAFLGLQFAGLAGICGLIGLVVVWRKAERSLAIYVLLLYLGAMAFAFAYRVGDRYVFYLPSYLPFTIWIGFGVQWLVQRIGARLEPRFRLESRFRRGAAKALLLMLVLALPVALYRIAPEVVSQGVSFRSGRHVPGPQSKYYFLWPPKGGYTDARAYAEQTLASLPPRAVLFADHILITPMLFLQQIEGTRPDVTLEVCCGSELQAAVGQGGDKRPLVLADVDPQIYPMRWLEESYHLVPNGPAYLLVAKDGTSRTGD